MDDRGGAGGPRPDEDEVEIDAALVQGLGLDAAPVTYRPLVRSADGMRLGMEALARPPVPGLMRIACEQLATWREAGLGRELIVHVRLDVGELTDSDVLETVWRTLAETRVGPGQLCLGVSASAIRAGEPATEATLRTLEDIGVRLALDGFGSGSSIEELARFQFDYAKLSGELLRGLEAPMHRARLISALLATARAVGTTLIAGGAERVGHRARVEAAGAG